MTSAPRSARSIDVKGPANTLENDRCVSSGTPKQRCREEQIWECQGMNRQASGGLSLSELEVFLFYGFVFRFLGFLGCSICFIFDEVLLLSSLTPKTTDCHNFWNAVHDGVRKKHLKPRAIRFVSPTLPSSPILKSLFTIPCKVQDPYSSQWCSCL